MHDSRLNGKVTVTSKRFSRLRSRNRRLMGTRTRTFMIATVYTNKRPVVTTAVLVALIDAPFQRTFFRGFDSAASYSCFVFTPRCRRRCRRRHCRRRWFRLRCCHAIKRLLQPSIRNTTHAFALRHRCIRHLTSSAPRSPRQVSAMPSRQHVRTRRTSSRFGNSCLSTRRVPTL